MTICDTRATPFVGGMMLNKKSRIAFTLLATACLGSLAVADDAATTAPASSIISVGDSAALEASKDKDVVVEGVVREAAWSNSGKVMNVHFEGAEETRFSCVVFAKNREKIDSAFAGDATQAWTGAKVRIKGKLSEYAGKVASRKATPQIVISNATQVTVIEPPAKQQQGESATQPSETPTDRATQAGEPEAEPGAPD